MTKYSFEWFLEQSHAAQRSIEQWPDSMKRNNFVAGATLPSQDELTRARPAGDVVRPAVEMTNREDR